MFSNHITCTRAVNGLALLDSAVHYRMCTVYPSILFVAAYKTIKLHIMQFCGLFTWNLHVTSVCVKT